ncbi:hypothetical protein TRFO_30555 [Tritrichomonas foetus]|uniref:Uncharacterized protein n=1 Tax=Tritrichomonas foetus TaxID=1144522 RepID=A0A1J4JTG7_9EUKA|nr:hypothetical protein TRFO_30555 [Tritrichomonas foetus]|eukprot:OHT02363.1 hypothetical protein TRFO_30555 [Tritrichomonas foetus]
MFILSWLFNKTKSSNLRRKKRMEQQRKIREFQRLLARSEKISDIEMLKLNVAELSNKFNDLSKEKLITSTQEKEFSNAVQRIQNKLNPKIVAAKKEKPKNEFKPQFSQNSEKDIAKERIKHNELANSLLDLSGQLVDRVSKVSVKVAEDEEIMKTVHENMNTISNGANQTQNQMNTTVSERLGWRAYKYLIIVIAVYLLITTIL